MEFAQTRIHKDAQGYYFTLPHVADKFYFEEILEEYEDQTIDLVLKPPAPEENGPYSGPHPQFPEDVPAAQALMKALDLQTTYPKIEDRLNSFRWLAHEYTTKGRQLGFKPEYGDSPTALKEWQARVKAKVIS